jgi:hypothetical protein
MAKLHRYTNYRLGIDFLYIKESYQQRLLVISYHIQYMLLGGCWYDTAAGLNKEWGRGSKLGQCMPLFLS